MSDPKETTSRLYALLIGVDCYLPNRLPDNSSYPSLGGCVRDIEGVESFLRTRLGLPDERIFKLRASDQGHNEPPEPPELWPTYENMVAAFERITAAAKAGDQVYIHYSGHGGRTPTAYPEVKGTYGLDESLVPTDIGSPGTRYLRDLELAHLLKRMADKGLFITVVLDSCHSGGATRGMVDSAVRGISSIDTTPRPTDSLVAPREELIASWQGLTGSETRGVLAGSLWVPESQHYLLLAACRPHELANEFAFDGKARSGALTYWLLDTLQNLGEGSNYRMLHNRLLGKVHAKFPQQTPQLLGDGTRAVFGVEQVHAPEAVRVLQVDAVGGRVQLNAGSAQGVVPQTQFAIYPATAADFSRLDTRLAIVEVAQTQPADSWATIIQTFGSQPLDAGFKAVLISRPARVRGRVRLTPRTDLIASIDQQAALQRVRDEIAASDDKGWVRLAEAGEAADFQVAVNANREYEIWDVTGRPLPNLRPALNIAETQAARLLIRRLTHLTKFQNIKLVDNNDPASTLEKQFIVEWVRDDGGAGAPQPLVAPGQTPVFDVDESALLRIKNNSNKVLNVTLLDLQPDWGVSKVYPPDADSEPLYPGAERFLPLRASLPENYDEGTDVLKVFATIEPTSFDWLLLPALDQPVVMRSTMRSAGAPLESLFAALTGEMPGTTRQVVLAAPTRADWACAQVEMKTRRRAPAIRHVRDPRLSLLQAAFSETIAEERKERATRGEAVPSSSQRPALDDPDNAILDEITDACLALADESALPATIKNLRVGGTEDGTTRGLWDTVTFCSKSAARLALSWWDKTWGDEETELQAYKDVLTERFGGCDPKFIKALTSYAQLLMRRGKIPYRRWQDINDFVITDKLPDQALIGFVADWGTGQPTAIEVLRQVKQLDPALVIHLGDIYYAGTSYEVENYFYKVWREVLQLDTSGIQTYTLAGNHDYYAGGEAYYELLDKLGQPASYYCLRNAHWQIIALDTALRDEHLKPGAGPTSLDPSELTWLEDKIHNNGGRRTILLSHHQLFSTSEQFEGQSYNRALYAQIEPLLPQVDLWLWGHEHDLVVFEPYMNTARARCIGGSAFPVGKYEMPATHINPLVPYKREVELSKGQSFYHHCYAMLKLDGAAASVSYYEDRDGGRILFTEEL
jgi:predicted phosphodiesterase